MIRTSNPIREGGPDLGRRLTLSIDQEGGQALVRRIDLRDDGSVERKYTLSWWTGAWIPVAEGADCPLECVLPLTEALVWPPVYEIAWPSTASLPSWFREEDVVSIHLATAPDFMRDICGARVICGRGDAPRSFDTIVTGELWSSLPADKQGAPILAAAALAKHGRHPWIRP